MAFRKLVSMTLICYASAVAVDEGLATMSKVFREMDMDKDGFLSPEEYGVPETFDPEMHDDEEIKEYKQAHREIKESFEKLDGDKDGRLSQAEIAKPMEVAPVAEADMLELDKDQDGSLSMAEFGTGLEFDFKDEFNTADKDHDGMISLEELKAFNKGHESTADQKTDAPIEEPAADEKAEAEEPTADSEGETPVADEASVQLLQDSKVKKNIYLEKIRQELDEKVRQIMAQTSAPKQICQQAGVVQFMETCEMDLMLMSAACIKGNFEDSTCNVTGMAAPTAQCASLAAQVCRAAGSKDDQTTLNCSKIACDESQAQYEEEVEATFEDLCEEEDKITVEDSACQNKTVGVITMIRVEAKPRSKKEIAAFPRDVQLNAGCKTGTGQWFYELGTEEEAIVQKGLLEVPNRPCQGQEKLCTDRANERLRICNGASLAGVACERKKVYEEQAIGDFGNATAVFKDAQGRLKYESCLFGMQVAMPRSKSEVLAAIHAAEEAGTHIWVGAEWSSSDGGKWKWIDGGIANVDVNKVPGSESKGLCIKTTVVNSVTTVKDDFLEACEKTDLHLVLCETRVEGAGLPHEM